MMRRISQLVSVCFGLALPAASATYNYVLQIDPFTGAGPPVAGWSVSWQSNGLLIPPSCGPGIDLNMQPDFVVSGAPEPGYSPSGTWYMCSAAGGYVKVTAAWSNGTSGISYQIAFAPTPPLSAPGVFNAFLTIVVGSPLLQFGPLGVDAMLTIAEVTPWPAIPHWFGSIIRVSLTEIAGPVTPPAGGPIEAIVGFVDLNGNAVGQPTQVSLIPGQVSSVELTDNAFGNAFGHTNVIPVVSAPQGPLLPAVQLTGEVFDSLTGFGAVLTSVTGLAPPPTSLAPQGLAGGQIMRIIASAYPPNTCVATLSFANSQGVAIGPSLPVSLSPGQSTPLDLTSAALNLKFGQQMVVQPLVALQPVGSAAAVVSPACAVSSDVFDTIVGRTWTYQFANVQ
jgi:hypothetical protein